MSYLPEFAHFDCADLASAGPRWEKWFEIMLGAMAIGDSATEMTRKKSLLLHYIGPECFDIYSTIVADTDSYADVHAKLTDYFMPKVNTDYERYRFRKENQLEGENLDQFSTRLKQMFLHCGFHAVHQVSQEIKSQIVQSCSSSSLRRKVLSKQMDLCELLDVGRAMELAETQNAVMEKSSEPVQNITA
ncbi:Uncharacterised protein r2_g3054 [Pycnogonum litorale]